MVNTFELILVLSSLIIGMLSALYFYQSIDIFTDLLKRPLKYISIGFIMIMFGVLLAVFILYQDKFNRTIHILGMPAEIIFFTLYIVGSIMIFIGSRQFSHRP